jgi:hypothetical protein
MLVYSKPFKTFCNIAVDKWLMQHPGQIFSIYNTAGCVSAAHQKAMTPTNTVAAFCTTGILPYDRDIFTEADFLSSFITDRPSEMLQEQEPLVTNEAGQEQEPLTTDATDPSNLNLQQKMFDFNPEDVHGYP